MKDFIFSQDSSYIFNHTHSELKAIADASLAVTNRGQRDNGVQSGFFSLLDLVANEVSEGNNILGEFPGFFRAMMDDEALFDTFKNKLRGVN